MYFRFAWRYFKAKKSANAINLIAWVTTAVIAFATCCQVLVLSVFNGFEGLVKSLYSSFYTDLKIVPEKGKTIQLTNEQLRQIQSLPSINGVSAVVEEKALLENENGQLVVSLKGVDSSFGKVSGVPSSMYRGQFDIGTEEDPKLVAGAGIEQAAGIVMNPAFAPDVLTLITPRSNISSPDPLELLSEGNVTAAGSFSIQQEFDNNYAITNLAFLKKQMNLLPNEYSAAEISINKNAVVEDAKKELQKILKGNYRILTKYEQNNSLYSTLRTERWAIFAILTLILIIAAFNMISALTMLVLEKKGDIGILMSMGADKKRIRRIFLSEGLLLGGIGTTGGILLSSVICFLQAKFKMVKMTGGSFLIDYFPVKLLAGDLLLVAFTAASITVLAAWLPAAKAASQKPSLR